MNKYFFTDEEREVIKSLIISRMMTLLSAREDEKELALEEMKKLDKILKTLVTGLRP